VHDEQQEQFHHIRLDCLPRRMMVSKEHSQGSNFFFAKAVLDPANELQRTNAILKCTRHDSKRSSYKLE
jgi:hypothetical protein